MRSRAPQFGRSRRSAAAALVVVLIGFGFGAGAAPAQPATVSAADARQVREVVQAQLDAFAVDDGVRAFSYATPALRQVFVTAERFMQMVRGSYPVVYRPASVAFLQPKHEEGDVIQRVQMSDAAGASWNAVYRLQRQGDGSWRIAGCNVTATSGKFA